MKDIFLAFPLFSIITCFFGAVLCSFNKKKVAFIISLVVCAVVFTLSCTLLVYCLDKNQLFIYTMGHFEPNEDGIRICNEIRFGPLESFLAMFFALILALCIIAGKKYQEIDIKEKTKNLYYVLMCLILVSNISLIYTNDIFTGFVFIEISTLASCGCLMVKEKGKNILATIRYMIFNLVGSGLFLIGIVTLYDITGCLSIENIATKLKEFTELPIQVIVSFSMITVGLSIKAGLFPFHLWMPDAYGCATPTSSSILSGMVTKGYIILLIKVIYRMFTYEVFAMTILPDILFVLGVVGMIVGSINAINQTTIDRMTAFSSAAQIGYIFMGIGLGVKAALIASLFHILSHAITKPLLFITSAGLSDASGGKKRFANLRGVGRVDLFSGIAFSVGALSMVGVPTFAGFISKFLFADAALLDTVPTWKTVLAITALVISALLNAIYFVRTIITIFSIKRSNVEYVKPSHKPMYLIGVSALAVLNIVLGLGSAFIISVLTKGYELFL